MSKKAEVRMTYPFQQREGGCGNRNFNRKERRGRKGFLPIGRNEWGVRITQTINFQSDT
jgi:hypothetical protein